MSKVTEEENNQDTNSDISNNEHATDKMNNVKLDDYISLIEKAKEPFKKEILKIPTKEEKLIYIRQQIQKYSIIKENSKISAYMSIFISFIIIISFIILFARTSNTIFFKSLMFAMLVVAGAVWIILSLKMKRNNRNYSIILFALEDISAKVSGSIGGGNDEVSKLNRELNNITEAINETKHEVREGCAIIEQKIRNNFKQHN